MCGTTLRDCLAHRRSLSLPSLPFIHGMAVPRVLLAPSFSPCQAVEYPRYGIARLRRRDCFAFDRARLPYLDAVENARRACCSHANGSLASSRGILARAEQHGCPSKCAHPPPGAHEHHVAFAEYADGARRESRSRALRRSPVVEEGSAKDAEAADPTPTASLALA
jgi:hypothetical protein